jgi:integrase/recombinase XerD
MARIFRPKYTRPIPAQAVPCEVRGRPGVRWKGRGGRWVYGVLGKPGRCTVESGKYRIEYTDHEGRYRGHKAYGDRAASEHKMRELSAQAERIAAGLLDVRASRPRLGLSELLDQWRRWIEGKGATTAAANREHQRASDVCEGLGAVRVSDLTPGAVLEWIGERRRSSRRFGAGTASNYIGSIKSFSRWCCIVERCEPADHLSALPRRRDSSDVRIQRRALNEKDLARLLNSVRQSEEEVYGLTGPERHALYLVACSTGLRASELARLTPNSFDLAAGEVTIDRPAKTRARAQDAIPVDPKVLRFIKPLLARTGPTWPNRCKPSQAWWLNGARMVARDLEAAGIPVTVGGRVFDFHALRGQFATDLERAGVPLGRAQKLMRHSDPRLTSKHYQKPERSEMAADVGKLKRGRR